MGKNEKAEQVVKDIDNADGNGQGRTHRQRRNVMFHKNLIVYINIYVIF